MYNANDTYIHTEIYACKFIHLSWQTCAYWWIGHLIPLSVRWTGLHGSCVREGSGGWVATPPMEHKWKPPIVMTKRTRASNSQKPSSSRPCIFLQCRCVGTKQTLPQASSYHNKTILPSSYLTPFDTIHTIPPQISTLASPATTSFTPHNHISPHTHTHTPRETRSCARCHRVQQQ